MLKRRAVDGDGETYLAESASLGEDPRRSGMR